jgi:hypothetical protein
MAASILSRVLAIALLAIPAGYVAQETDNRDWQMMQEYSRSELLAYLELIRMPSHLAAIVVLFLVICGVTACVESLAWLIRWLAFRANKSDARQG